MLRGLSSKYRHAIPVITAKQPPHTFLSARSYLLLEEHYDKEHAKTAAHHALIASGGSWPSSSSTSDGGDSSQAPARSSSDVTEVASCILWHPPRRRLTWQQLLPSSCGTNVWGIQDVVPSFSRSQASTSPTTASILRRVKPVSLGSMFGYLFLLQIQLAMFLFN